MLIYNIRKEEWKIFFFILNRWIDIYCSNLELKIEIEYMFKFEINLKIILI